MHLRRTVDKRELLAKMVARGIDPGAVTVSNGGGSGGGVTGLDVAAMMAPLSQFESDLLRAKYCDDRRSLAAAWACWREMLRCTSKAEGWRPKKAGVLDALSRVTFAEHVSENLCPGCLGARARRDAETGRWLECDTCGGSGRMYLPGREIAKRLGFPDEGLKDPWKTRVTDARRRLVAIEESALSRMR